MIEVHYSSTSLYATTTTIYSFSSPPVFVVESVARNCRRLKEVVGVYLHSRSVYSLFSPTFSTFYCLSNEQHDMAIGIGKIGIELRFEEDYLVGLDLVMIYS